MLHKSKVRGAKRGRRGTAGGSGESWSLRGPGVRVPLADIWDGKFTDRIRPMDLQKDLAIVPGISPNQLVWCKLKSPWERR